MADLLLAARPFGSCHDPSRSSLRGTGRLENGWRKNAPQTEMGAGIAASPHCAEHGYVGVRNQISRSFTVLDPDSPAQASFPIAAARESLAFSSFPSRRKFHLGPLMSRPKTKQLRCSTALLGMTTSASRFARPTPRGVGAASRKRKIISSGASSQLATDCPRRNAPLPAGRDRNFGHCRPKETATAVPIT